MTDDIIGNNILPFKHKKPISSHSDEGCFEDVIFTDGVEEYNVEEYVDSLVEDLEVIQWEMQAILDYPEGLSNVRGLEGLVAELTNVIDGYNEDVV